MASSPTSLRDAMPVPQRPREVSPPTPRTCTLPEWTPETVSGTVCDGVAHLRYDGMCAVYVGVCPDERRRQAQDRVASEVARLQGTLSRLLPCRSPHGLCACAYFVSDPFGSYNPRLHPASQKALDSARDFVAGAARQLLLVGERGLGKTHLLLASHFALMGGGVRSEYVTCAELRQLFLDSESFDAHRRGVAEGRLRQVFTMDVIHLDELGEGQGDATGRFYAKLKGLVDPCGARFAVGACKGLVDLAAHPDVTPLLVSRFVDGARFVELRGIDERTRRPT